MHSGVYEIRNTKDNKIYIGSSVDVDKRMKTHVSHLRKNNHENSKLQRAVNKYGIDNFVFSVLIYCDKGMVREYEQIFIDKMNPEYNISPFARGGGFKISDSTKRKMSLSHKNKKNTDEHNKNISLAKMGEGHHLCKLKDSEINELRKIGRTGLFLQRRIANAWGLSPSYVSRLLREERR